NGGAWSFIQNKEDYTAYDLTQPVIANYVCLRPTTADNTSTNYYSFTLYNASHSIVATTGAIHGSTFASSAAMLCGIPLSTTAILLPGRYYASFTTNCSTSCAALSMSQNVIASPVVAYAGNATVNGIPNTTISPPASSWATTSVAPWFEVHQ
ncbi:MAG TPA: hypothetical protein VMD29_00575, partial [Terracidiphilus sp.]|nr:hypothetical protein [Terracidiphilus sp.]